MYLQIMLLNSFPHVQQKNIGEDEKMENCLTALFGDNGVGKIGGCLKNGGIIYFHTKQPILALSFSECLVYLCFVYLHQYYFKNLVLCDLVIYFYKSKEISMMSY